MAKLDRELLIETIEAKQGIITAVAQSLNVSRRAIYDAAERWQTVKEAIHHARFDYDEGLLDEAEIKLREAVRGGESWAVRYTIDKKGKSRGYIDKYEIDLKVSDLEKLSDDELRAIAES